ncbi:MAG TPA: sulfatase/phosphatase domain-containing protein, partial [Planctomycetota bacterium]|nr:sulfatase/phosphatase domain-containing protein [Planctomycetota bacterium]
ELHGKGVMLRTHQWKYVRRLYDVDELYDLSHDPDELVNLIDEPKHADVVRELSEKMLDWFLDTGDAVPFKWDKRAETEDILEI